MIDKSIRQLQEMQGGGLVPDPDEERRRLQAARDRAYAGGPEFEAITSQVPTPEENRLARRARYDEIDERMERERAVAGGSYPSEEQSKQWRLRRRQDEQQRGRESEQKYQRLLKESTSARFQGPDEYREFVDELDKPEYHRSDGTLYTETESYARERYDREMELWRNDQERVREERRQEQREQELVSGEADRKSRREDRREEIRRGHVRGDSIRQRPHPIREFIFGEERSQEIQRIETEGMRKRQFLSEADQDLIDEADDLVAPGFRSRLKTLHDQDPSRWPSPEETEVRMEPSSFGRGLDWNVVANQYSTSGWGEVYDKYGPDVYDRLRVIMDEVIDATHGQVEERRGVIAGQRRRNAPVLGYGKEMFGAVTDALGGEGRWSPQWLAGEAGDSSFGQWVGRQRDKGIAGLSRAKDWAISLPGRGIDAAGRGARSAGRGMVEAGEHLAEGAVHEPGWGRTPPIYGGDRNIKTPAWLEEFQTGDTGPIPHANRAARALGYSQNRRR